MGTHGRRGIIRRTRIVSYEQLSKPNGPLCAYQRSGSFLWMRMCFVSTEM